MSTQTDVERAAIAQDFTGAGEHLAEAITLVKRLRDSPAFFGSDDAGLFLANAHARLEGGLELLRRALKADQRGRKQGQ